MRLLGIDSIRFICASVVVFGHFGNPPLFSDAYDYIFLYKIIHGIYNCLFNGPAAVIVFFIVSGLVIHYPYVEGKEVNVWEFYTKRYIRIIIPMLVITVLAFLVGDVHRPTDVFWSLYAELIYYFLYPFILKLKKQIGILSLIVIVYFIGLALFFLVPYENKDNYIDLGIGLTWIIGLPSWLTGLLLAEKVRRQTDTVTFTYLFMQRMFIWGLTIIMMVIHFQLHISNILLLNMLIVPFYFWLKNEIDYYKTRAANIYLENLGKWSYSLYIVHPLVVVLLIHYNFLNFSAPWISWIVGTLSAFILSYIFYLLVEKPSHILTQKIKINRN